MNQHGPKPFRLSLSPDGDETKFNLPANILADGFKYTITANTPDVTDAMTLKFIVPNTPCDKCVLQLMGMGNLPSGGEWYSCADVTIGPPPVCPAACEQAGRGKCEGAKCVCTKGWAGVDCTLATADDGGIVLKVSVVVKAGETFDQTAFKSKLSAAIGVQVSSITVLAATPMRNDASTVEVTFKVKDSPASAGATITATQSADKITTAVTNKQLDTGYALAETQPGMSTSSTTANQQSTTGSKKSSTPLIAGIAIPVALLAIGAVIGFVLYSKNKKSYKGPNGASTPALPPRV